MKFDSRPLAERILARTRVVGECFVWVGCLVRGYGQIQYRQRRYYVHRLVYEAVIGPVPEDRELDHVRALGCVGGACWNPAHLEVVTHGENVQRWWNDRKATEGDAK